jgi:hypothetical protein
VNLSSRGLLQVLASISMCWMGIVGNFVTNSGINLNPKNFSPWRKRLETVSIWISGDHIILKMNRLLEDVQWKGGGGF